MILNEFFDSNKKHSPQQWLAEGLDAEAYKQKLLSSLPGMMRFFEKNVQGWRPSREQMLAAIETGYTVMKHTGDVKQAGRAVMDELNTLHRMSQGEQDVAEGKMAELEMDLEDPEITDRQFEKMYGMTRKEAREQFSQTDMWAFPEIRDPNQPLHERGVVEAFGPLPKDNQQIRLGRHTVNIERVGLDKNYISFAWHDSKGQEHYEEVAVGDLGSYDDLIKRIKQEISYQERKYTDQGVTEGLNEMDKSAPQPGRDGKVSQSTYGSRDKKSSDYFKGKEAPGKAITAKQASKDALDILKKQGVAEGSNDTIYPNAEVIKSKNGRPVGEIYQDGNSWGCFHYRADRGYDMIDTRADAIQALKDLHQETGRSGPDNTFKGVAEAINPDITNPAFSHQQQIGDYLYVARYWGRRKNPIGLKISAYHGNKLIGRADLMYHSAPFDDFADPETTPNRMWLESEITEVNPKYQRQGIMSTMYAYARMLGNTVKPSQTRSDDAKAAWASWRQSGDKEHLTKMRAEGVAEGYQLDEGAMETISTLVKKLPGIGKYYQIAQQYKPQLVQILKTSKSGKEVKQKMEALLAQTSTPVAEAGWMKQLGGLAVGGGSILSTMWMNAMGMIDGVLAHAAAGEVGGAVASGSILGLIPVTLMLFAAMLLFKGSKQSSDEKAQAFQAQRGQQGVAEGSGPKEKQKTPYRDINSAEYRAAAEKQKQQMAKDKLAEPGKKLLAKKGISEVSDATKQNYKAKAQAQVKELEPHAKKGEYRDIAQRAIDRRQRGLNRLANRSDAVAAQTLAPRVSEGLTVPEGRPALGQANITTLIQTYKRNEPFAELSFGKSGDLRINRQQMRLIMDHYLKLQTPEEKHDFVYETMSRMLKLIAMFDGYGIDVRSQIAVPPGQTSSIPGAQPQLFELDAGEVKDTRLSRALKQARAEFPTAGSDIEAFLKLVMSNDDRDLATMDRMQAVNKKQSQLLDRIQTVDQKQNQEINNLESELDRVTQINQNLERELDRIQSAKPSAAADRKDRKDAGDKPAAGKPAAKVDLPVGQDISTKTAKKTKAQVPSKVGYGIPTSYKTTLQPPKYSMPQLQAPAQAQLPAPAQRTADQSDLFRDIIDVVPRAVTPTANGTNRNPMISSLDQEITDIFQPAANDDEAQRQANAESRDPQRAIAHTDFDDPEWHEKVRRVGQRAQQGPLKTVWDPVKRVYRNVPVDQPANKKPNMNEARLHRRAVLRQILES